MKRGLLVPFALSCLILGALCFAQDNSSARPMFVTLPPHSDAPVQQAEPAAQLPQWTYTFTSSVDHRTYKPVIVGTDPSTTNTSTTVMASSSSALLDSARSAMGAGFFVFLGTGKCVPQTKSPIAWRRGFVQTGNLLTR